MPGEDLELPGTTWDGAPPPADADADSGTESASSRFRIALPNFEGPLDLLLHLIREHKIDILDIPVALITEKYLEALAQMREVNLDIAGEFLVMAATLAHLKSRMLLPREESASQLEAPEEAPDPRAELVRRLLDYQRYKDAGERLSRRPVLGRDVFVRRALDREKDKQSTGTFLEVSVYRLIESLDQVLQAAAPDLAHEVMRERLSVTQAMVGIVGKIRQAGEVSFVELFEGERSRNRIVVIFLALLEMCKQRWLVLTQALPEEGGEIRVSAQGAALEGLDLPEVDDHGYR